MTKRNFMQNTTLLAGGLLSSSVFTQSMRRLATRNTERMPVLFMGHGSPMNGIEDNKYTRVWSELTNDIPSPTAILIISAHWETHGTQIFAGEKTKMIYDMYGFPKPLYQVKYSAPGHPELAKEIVEYVSNAKVSPTHEWGLDHGAWSVLTKMYPEANIPCFQMSLNKTRDIKSHYELGKELAFLRDRGVLILSSGNIVHNLRYMRQMNEPAPDWALDFDHHVEHMINSGDHQPLIEYQKMGQAGLISVNSAEHYIPLLYTLALQQKKDIITYFNHDTGNTLMDVMMRCVKIG